MLELNRALNDHELIKIKLSCGDREAKKALTLKLCEDCGCELVQAIGNVALVFRAAAKPNPRLSNILRANG